MLLLLLPWLLLSLTADLCCAARRNIFLFLPSLRRVRRRWDPHFFPLLNRKITVQIERNKCLTQATTKKCGTVKGPRWFSNNSGSMTLISLKQKQFNSSKSVLLIVFWVQHHQTNCLVSRNFQTSSISADETEGVLSDLPSISYTSAPNYHISSKQKQFDSPLTVL